MENHKGLIDKLTALHTARQYMAVIDGRWKVTENAFFALHADDILKQKMARDAVAHLTGEVRTEALTLYATIPNMGKTDLPGITIRETKVYGYDPEAALAWAKEHKTALRLDEAAYKKLVGVPAIDAPGTVTIELIVAIAQDLTPFVNPAPGQGNPNEVGPQ